MSLRTIQIPLSSLSSSNSLSASSLSLLTSYKRELQDKLAKVVAGVKKVNEDPVDRDARNALHLSSRVLVLAAAKFLYAFEEIKFLLLPLR